MNKLLLSFKLITRIPCNVRCTKSFNAPPSSSLTNTREFFSSSSSIKFLSNTSSSIPPPKSHHNMIYYEAFSKTHYLKNQSVNFTNGGGIVLATGSNLSGKTSVGSSNQSYYRASHHGRSWFPSAENVLWGLIGANVVVFTMWKTTDPSFMKDNFMISLDNFKSGRVHTMITSAFSQIDNIHFLSNLICLLFFGNPIGVAFGPRFLLNLYLAGAIGGSVFYLVRHALMDPPRKNNPELGADGAVNAIMLLYVFLCPRAKVYFCMVIPIPAMLLGAYLVGDGLYRMKNADGMITGEAHLGGAVVAAIAWLGIRRRWWI